MFGPAYVLRAIFLFFVCVFGLMSNILFLLQIRIISENALQIACSLCHAPMKNRLDRSDGWLILL